MAQACCWPPERLCGLFFSIPTRREKCNPSLTRSLISAEDKQKFSGPKASSSSTVELKSWFDGLSKHNPVIAERTGTSYRLTSRSATLISPFRSPRKKCGINPLVVLQRVVFPAPLGPVIMMTSPGLMSRSIPSIAYPVEPSYFQDSSCISIIGLGSVRTEGIDIVCCALSGKAESPTSSSLHGLLYKSRKNPPY